MAVFARCKCFLNSNIYLSKYDMHVKFENESSFRSTYEAFLKSKGCTNFDEVIEQVQNEMQRRRHIPEQSRERRTFIQEHYVPKYPAIYNLRENYFHSAYLEAFREYKSSRQLAALKKMLKSHKNEVYSFPLFSSSFCKELCKELNNFELSSMPKSRPNSMNRFGVLLEELGFNETFLNPLRKNYIEPMCRLLFPAETGEGLDSHKAFTVHYEIGKDLDLGFHFDNAEVTLNLCLGAACQGGELNFGTFGLEHKTGYAILHRGLQQHSVLPLESGRRINLIMWMRSSSVRNYTCPMCNSKPVLEPVQYGWGDGFTV